MIVECPKCKTAHSKGEQELASGAPIVCRRCGTSFAPPARGGDPLQAASPATPARPPDPPRGLAFELDVPVAAAPPRPATFTPPAAPARPATVTPPAARPGIPSSDAVAPAPSAVAAAAADPLALDLDVDLGLDAASAPTVSPVGGPPPPASPAVISLELDDTGERRAASGHPVSAGGPSLGLSGTVTASSVAPATAASGARPVAPSGLPSVAPSGASSIAAAGASSGVPPVAPSVAPLTPVSSPIPAPSVPFASDPVPSSPASAGSARSEPRGRDDATRAHPAGARGNVFPREAWARLRADLLSYLRAASWRVRVAAAAVALVPVAVPVGLVLALRPSHPVAYVSETEPLLGGPLDGDAYPRLAPVDRGGRVEIIETAGDFALVRDSLGRVGFLPGRSLDGDAPEALPSRPFADCRRAPRERSTGRCHSRAKEQFDSCRGVCGGHAEGSACLEHCQRRFSDCLAACESEPQPLAPAVAPSAPEPKTVRREPAPASTTAVPDGVKRKPRRGVKAKKKPPR